jgi:hypothetical protein
LKSCEAFSLKQDQDVMKRKSAKPAKKPRRVVFFAGFALVASIVMAGRY